MTFAIPDSASSLRTTLGLGTAATLDSGTSANNVVVLDGSGALPAVDGSNLTGMGQGSLIFMAKLSSNLTVGDSSHANVTASMSAVYDPSSSFVSNQFKPSTAGWYYIYAQGHGDFGGSNLSVFRTYIVKNGTRFLCSEQNEGGGYSNEQTTNAYGIIYLNGSTDYLTMDVYFDSVDGATRYVMADHTSFGGWLLST